jgi:hypothetical protein
MGFFPRLGGGELAFREDLDGMIGQSDVLVINSFHREARQ